MFLKTIDEAGEGLRNLWLDAFRDGPPTARVLGCTAAILVGFVVAMSCTGVLRLIVGGVFLVLFLAVCVEAWIETRRAKGADTDAGAER